MLEVVVPFVIYTFFGVLNLRLVLRGIMDGFLFEKGRQAHIDSMGDDTHGLDNKIVHNVVLGVLTGATVLAIIFLGLSFNVMYHWMS